jgi:hypothetical protein
MPIFKPNPEVRIEAIQFLGTGKNVSQIQEFLDRDITISYEDPKHPIFKLETRQGVVRVSVGDWIIKALRGEFYPCKPDVFKQKYEYVSG